MNKLLYFGFTLFVLFATSACVPIENLSTDDTDDTSGAPFDLPPLEGFVLDFKAMDSASSKAIAKALSYYDYSDAPMSKVIEDYSDSLPSYATQGFIPVSNYNFAAARVLGWSVLTAVGMAIPTASFVKAFDYQPSSIGDGKWQWAYSVTVALQTYDARLVGAIVGDQVTWEMYLSRGDGEFSDVNWYSGSHNIAATSGSWTLRQRDNATGQISDFIEIDWERDLTAGTRHIRYTNLADNGYIENGISTDTSYDAYFNIDNKELPALINIEWNSSDKSGRVRSSNIDEKSHFGHTDWNCWASAAAADPYADKDCS